MSTAVLINPWSADEEGVRWNFLSKEHLCKKSNFPEPFGHISNCDSAISYGKPYLSIVVASRHDDYDANILHRMQVFAKGLAEQCKRFNLDAELIIVEWNPPTDRKRLHEVLDWPDDLGPLTVRFIEVPAEIHNSIGNSDKLPFFQMIAKNVGIRRAKGKFVLATNIDILFSNKLMQFLASGRLDENCFYRIDRHDVGSKILPECKDINKQLEFCRNNIVRVHGLYGTKKISEMESDHFIYDSKDKKLHTNGCGDFTLMSRTNWHLFRAYPELRKWSIYVDGLLLHMAYVSGLHQVILPEPMRIYHIEHDMSWAVSDEAKQKLTTERYPTCRAVALSRLGLDYQKEYLVWCRQMIEAGKPITNNNEHWGYAQTEFKEYVISGRWKGQMTNRNVISQDNNRKPFQEWIDTLALTQNRLYYRDQTPKSLNMLLELVHRYKPTKIVELGTLSGLSLRAWLAAKSRAEVIAIDLSFKPLFRSQKVLPVELSGVRLLEQDILKTDFGRLWSEEDRVILYVDAHDTPNAPIIAHVLNNAVPALPRSHVIAVDDLWYCSEQVSERSVSEFFKQVVAKEIDYLGCFEGYYAPYWKGGFFIGFPEVVPLMEWVSRNKVDLIFEPGGKVAMFERPAGPSNAAGDGFDSEGFNRLTGSLHHNPVGQIRIYEEKDVAAGQQAEALCRRAIELFAASRIEEALGCLNRAAGLTSNISGAFYGMGVCLVRLGRFDLAVKMLESEVNGRFAHPNVRILYEDVKNHAAGEQSHISKQARQGRLKGFTIFAMPKAFTGLFATIQRNAMESWVQLTPSPEIILLGDDDGVADAARRYGCRHIPKVERNEFGTPLLDDIFQKAQAAASNEICVYANADIILMDNFAEAIESVARRFSEFLMVGRRWDIDISQEIDFAAADWQQRLTERVSREGVRHAPTGIDYFAFKKGLWPKIPPLVLGREVWDNYLVREALLAGRPVIDASGKVTIVHQNHDFSHVPGGKKARSFDIEVRRNLDLAGNDRSLAYTSHASWELTPAGIALRPISEFLKGDNFSAALKCIESAYQQAPEIVAGQCEALGRQMDAGLRTNLLSAAKREVVSGSAKDAAKLLLNCLEMENRPAAENPAGKELRFSFVMIVLNGMPFIEYSLKSVYDFAHEIIIVEGAVENCMFAAGPDGSSTDGTVEFIKSFPDPRKKVRLIQGRWPEKCEMQNEALKYVTGDYVWLIDSDEVYKHGDLAKVREILSDDSSITQVNFIPDNFWKGPDYIVYSSKFFEFSNHFRRLFKFVPGAVFISHRPPTMVWPGRNKTTEQMHLLDGTTTRRMGLVMHHYNYILDGQVKQKNDYYGRMDRNANFRGYDRQSWYNECFLKWNPQNREEIESRYPVWLGDEHSRTEPFTGTHPEVMSDSAAVFRSNSPVAPGTSRSSKSVPTATKGNALVSYITAPIRMGLKYQPYMFSNAGIARSMVKVLVEMGYVVDLIDWTCMDFKSDKGYDLFVGHAGANWEYLSRNVVGQAVKIYFATGIYWRQFNRREAERFAALERRRGVRLPYDRWIQHSEEFACHDADGIVCLGNGHAAESYRQFPVCFNLNNGCYADDRYNPSSKDFESGRRRFLYFGSTGNVHKGLDLLVEAFMQLDAELWCAGRLEPAFAEVYGQILAGHPNIHFVDWVELRSPLFYKLINLCNCTIFVSCAEGSSGGVVECMNQGLIPIVSRDVTIDVDDFGIMLQNNSVEEIARTVREVSAKPAEWHREHSIKARQAALRDYSQQAFEKNLRAGIEHVISRSQRVRAERERAASLVMNAVTTYCDVYRNDVGALLRGADFLKSCQRHDEAAQLWQRALVVEPSCVTAMCELAAYCTAGGQAEKAGGIAKRALRHSPLDKQALAILRQSEQTSSHCVVSNAHAG